MNAGIAIISHPRSGSTMLGDMLSSHPDLDYRGETFVKGENIVINLKYNDIFFKGFDLAGFKIIHLTRENKLKLFASYCLHTWTHDLGEKANVKKEIPQLLFRVQNKDENQELKIMTQIIVDSDKASKMLGEFLKVRDYAVSIPYKKMFKILRQMTIDSDKISKRFNSFDITYEEITGNKSVSILNPSISKRLCKFLEVKDCELSTDYIKMNSDSLENIVWNYEDFKVLCSKTEFASML